MGKGTMLDSIGTEETSIDLETALDHVAGFDAERTAAAEIILTIAAFATELEALIAAGPLATAPAGGTSSRDRQETLDMIADDMLIQALSTAPVAVAGSAKRPKPVILDEEAPIAVAIDPLNGSSNIDTNISVGTLFSLLPVMPDSKGSMLQPGRRQIAAGFVVYGPQTCLVLTLGDGTDIYTLDRREGRFIRTRTGVLIADDSADYAIDASNYRHWDKAVQAYVDDNVAGIDGPRGKNFDMRWIASLVAEAYRILIRGGIFLAPGDRREGYEKGRLHLVYEANPLAMLIEQAGGLATDGEDPVLDLLPRELHQRVPLVFGSSAKVARVKKFHDGTLPIGERSPLFGRRGLFRH